MKQVLKLLLHYFSWSTVIIWLVRVGFVLLTAGILASLLNANDFANKLISLSWLSIFVFPYIALPGYFRIIISNQRLGLIPGFYLNAGIAAVLFTLLTAITRQVISTFLDLDGLVPGTVPFFFFIATLYFAFVQLFITSKYVSQLIGLGSLSSSALVFYLVANGFPEVFLTTKGQIILMIISSSAWLYGLATLKTKTYFKPAFNLFAGQKDKEAFKNLWDNRNKHSDSSTPQGTLLLGGPDGVGALLIAGAMWTLVFPLSVSLVLFLFSLFIPADAFPPMPWIFLGISGFLGGFSTLASSELIPRARLLWLRYGSNRKTLWQHMESVILRSWACIYLWALAAAAILSIFKIFSTVLLLNYLLFIPASSAFLLYLSLMLRLRKWPGALKGLLYLASLTVPIFFIFKALGSGSFIPLNLLEVVFILLAFALRQIARNAFLGIDWFLIQPFRISGTYQY